MIRTMQAYQSSEWYSASHNYHGEAQDIPQSDAFALPPAVPVFQSSLPDSPLCQRPFVF